MGQNENAWHGGALHADKSGAGKTRNGGAGLHTEESGNVIFVIAIAMIAIVILPPIVMAIWPPAKFLFQIMMVFIVYSIVRGYLGTGILTLLVSGVLIYFLVFKYTYIFATLFMFQLLLSVQVFSVIIWGVGMTWRKGGG